MVLEYNSFKLRAGKATHRQGLVVNSYALFEPVDYKTNIRGYWTDKAGKVYKDNLKIDRHTSWQGVKKQAIKLCIDKSQLCIFVKGSRHGYIVDPRGNISNIFKGKRVILLTTWGSIRKAIRQYKEGLTIYKDIKGYRAEVYI